jgi:hypothetical protein
MNHRTTVCLFLNCVVFVSPDPSLSVARLESRLRFHRIGGLIGAREWLPFAAVQCPGPQKRNKSYGHQLQGCRRQSRPVKPRPPDELQVLLATAQRARTRLSGCSHNHKVLVEQPWTSARSILIGFNLAALQTGITVEKRRFPDGWIFQLRRQHRIRCFVAVHPIKQWTMSRIGTFHLFFQLWRKANQFEHVD